MKGTNNKVIKSLNEAVRLSEKMKSGGDLKEFECDFTLNISGNKYKAHEASICRGDILFFTDKACLNYVVDYYDGNGVAELFNIDE